MTWKSLFSLQQPQNYNFFFNQQAFSSFFLPKNQKIMYFLPFWADKALFFYLSVTPSWVGLTGMILPFLSNYILSAQTSRCIPGPFSGLTKCLLIRCCQESHNFSPHSLTKIVISYFGCKGNHFFPIGKTLWIFLFPQLVKLFKFRICPTS